MVGWFINPDAGATIRKSVRQRESNSTELNVGEPAS